MRKINSIGYGHKIIGVAAIFLIVIPLVSLLLSSMTKQVDFFMFSKISFALGSVISLFLLVLLKIEFFQDKKNNEYFEANKNIKQVLENGLYECQACGNKQVMREHKYCIVCGANFRIRSEQNASDE